MNLKKILAGVLACCIIGGTMPAGVRTADNAVITASADDEFTIGEYESLYYINCGDHIEITGCDESATSVVIPDEIDGLPVTTIVGAYNDPGAFTGCTKLTSITFPDTITSIGANTFWDTPWLAAKQAENPLVIVNGILIDGQTCSSDVVIPDNVKTISGGAFRYCEGLTSITMPDSVTSIDGWAFQGCANLTSITMSDNITSIGEFAFSECLQLTDITIPDSVTSIDACAFSWCKNLWKITIYNPNCEIYDSSSTISSDYSTEYFNGTIYGYENSTAQAYAKKYNRTFESLGEAPEVPADVLQYIKYDDHIEITGCDTSATEVVIPAEIDGVPVTTIGDNAFNGCKALTGITIPDSVTSIGSSAFYDCTKLTEIIIPESATYIGADAFKGCSSLKNITIPDSLTEFSAGVFADTLWLKSRQEEDPLVVVNGTLIDGTTCSGEVVVPESVRKIGYCAFSDCTKLTEIIIPESVQSIGDFAFDRCTGLTRITILNPECSISYYDVGVSGDTIPENATVYGYDNSTAYEFAKEYNRKFVSLGKAPVDAVAYENHGDYIEITSCDESATEVVIPAEINGVPVTSIGERAFNGCTGLTSITIPDSVTSIGDWAFLDCTELTDIIIPDSVTSIGAGAFGNTGLTEVTIPDSVTSISKEAFSFCSGLKTITILNPECKIADIESVIYNSYDEDSSTFVYSGVIKGYSGSTAEAYAKKYNKTFEAIIEPEFLLGDVTQDGIINGSDATLALRAYTLTSSSLDDELDDIQFKAADVDGDGQLTGSDATLILRYYTLLSSITDGSTLPPIEEWIKNS